MPHQVTQDSRLKNYLGNYFAVSLTWHTEGDAPVMVWDCPTQFSDFGRNWMSSMERTREQWEKKETTGIHCETSESIQNHHLFLSICTALMRWANVQSISSTSEDSFSPTMFSAVQLIFLLWSCDDRLNSRSTELWPDASIWVCNHNHFIMKIHILIS